MAEKRRGPGRPSKGHEAKKAHFDLRITLLEKEAFAEAADLAGLNLANWMRQRLRESAKRELRKIGRPVAFEVPPNTDE